MHSLLHRRRFIQRVGSYGASTGAALLSTSAIGERRSSAQAELPRPADHELAVIQGTPRERGRQYGRQFRDPIRAFLDREIYQSFTRNPPARDDLLRYSAACAGEIKRFSPLIFDELEGMSEGSGLDLDETVLITLHEELWHRGVLPSIPHCTAVAAGPPDTRDGQTYVGQTWDWMESVYGLSTLLHWKRPEGPSVLAYAYPGLWVGAGMNSAGIALCWTSGDGLGIAGPRVGIPSYVLIAQMLYQKTLDAALAEARRAKHAGWFTFVVADGEGRLANVEGTPRELAVETGRGRMARVMYGSRAITGTPPDKEVKLHPRCTHMNGLLAAAAGKLDRAAFERALADHGDPDSPGSTVCVHPNTLDAMLFNTTRREAYLTRGPTCAARWKRFTFDGPE